MRCPHCHKETDSITEPCPHCERPPGDLPASSTNDDEGSDQPITADREGDLTRTFHGRSVPPADLPSPATSSSDEQLGTTISNRYEILSEIGRGGFATVYRALDKKLGREVAIKRLRLDVNAEDSQDRITRFIREAQLIASLNHRNIVHVYDHDTDDLGHYIVMEYIPGLSLAAYCKQEGAIAPLKAVELIQGVCLGLSYAHRKQLIHRDIKPANILLLEEDDELIPKIVDFGLARIGSHSDISATGYYLGTPFYMAPEQMGDIKSTTHRADIYAVGKTLYEMVSDTIPDNVDPAKIPPPSQLTEIIFKCTKASVEERYFSMEELYQELDTLFTQSDESKSTISSSLLTNLCPECNSANKDQDHFCRTCGTGLTRPCLECEHNNSLHADFCGSCGCPVRKTFQLMEIQHQVAALREEKQWEEITQACQLETFDLDALGPLAQQIVVVLDGAGKQAARWQLEAEELSLKIQNAVDAAEFEGLLPKIQRYRQLVPGNPELDQLFGEIERRENLQTDQAQDVFSEATHCFDRSEDERVIELIGSVSNRYRTADMQSLLEQAERRNERVQELTQLIQGAQGKGGHDSLLTWVNEYLTYRPADTSISQVRDELRQQQQTKNFDHRQSIHRTLQSKQFIRRLLILSAVVVLAGLIIVLLYRQLGQSPPAPGNPSPPTDGTTPVVPNGWITDARKNLLAKQPLLNSINMVLVPVRAGSFEMGDADTDSGNSRHLVNISRDFYLSSYEVTQEQYQLVMDNNPSRFVSPQSPVENVSWQDAQAFCLKLSHLERAASFSYRLPTEAEWEYSCRAGEKADFSFGEDIKLIDQHAWYNKNSSGQSHQVGSKRPNAWHLFDMHGNVMEWCQDWHQETYDQSSRQQDPVGPKTGKKRVVRGGSWDLPAPLCASSQRFMLSPSTRYAALGFRVVLLANQGTQSN